VIGHLADRLLRPDPVRDVLGLTDEVARFTLPVPQQGGGKQGPEDPPVLVDISFLLTVTFNFTLEKAHRLFDLLGDVIRMGNLLKIHPEKFLFRIAQQLDQSGIDENKFSPQVHHGDAGARMLNHHPEMLFTFPQFLFQAALVGDVPQGLDGADDLSNPVVNRPGLGPEKSSFLPGEGHIPLGADHIAVPAKIVIIVLPGQLGIEDVIDQQGTLYPIKVQGVNPVTLAQDLFPGRPRHLGDGPVPVHDLSGPVDCQGGFGNEIQEPPQSPFTFLETLLGYRGGFQTIRHDVEILREILNVSRHGTGNAEGIVAPVDLLCRPAQGGQGAGQVTPREDCPGHEENPREGQKGEALEEKVAQELIRVTEDIVGGPLGDRRDALCGGEKLVGVGRRRHRQAGPVGGPDFYRGDVHVLFPEGAVGLPPLIITAGGFPVPGFRHDLPELRHCPRQVLEIRIFHLGRFMQEVSGPLFRFVNRRISCFTDGLHPYLPEVRTPPQPRAGHAGMSGQIEFHLPGRIRRLGADCIPGLIPEDRFAFPKGQNLFLLHRFLYFAYEATAIKIQQDIEDKNGDQPRHQGEEDEPGAEPPGL